MELIARQFDGGGVMAGEVFVKDAVGQLIDDAAQ